MKQGNVIVNTITGEEATVHSVKVDGDNNSLNTIYVKNEDGTEVSLRVVKDFSDWKLKLCDEAELGFCDYGNDSDIKNFYTDINSCRYCKLYRAELELRKGNVTVGTMKLGDK